VFVDSSPVVIFTAFIGTVAVRSLILAVPIALVAVQRRFQSTGLSSPAPARIACGVFAALLLSNIVLMEPLESTYSWGGLNRKPDTRLLSFIKSSKFEPGATYRILRAHDGKIGMYQLVEHRARLDSEFFPESIARNSWPDVAAYSQFLRNRRVDFVIVFGSYDREWRTNEHDLLRELTDRNAEGCVETLVGVHPVTANKAFDVYGIRRAC
jgi:hypothetical protein